MSKTLRQSNIELLRILLILMIITHHVIVHGLGMKKIGWDGYQVSTATYFELFVNSFVIIAVNVFVFISGYYGIKFKFRTVLSFVLQAMFYSLGFFLLYAYFDKSLWSLEKLWHVLIPISYNQWWFLSIYMGLFFVSPILNKGIDLLETGQRVVLLAGLLYIDCFSGFMYGTISGNGYTAYHFIVMYVLARTLNQYVLTIKGAWVYLICFPLILFGIAVFKIHTGKLIEIWPLFTYHNPLIMLSAIMLFYTFQNIKFQNRYINLISGAIFGVYLIHENEFVRKSIYQFISQVQTNYSTLKLILVLIITILTVFIVSTIIELARKKVFDKLIETLVDRWQENVWIQQNKKQWVLTTLRKVGVVLNR